MFRSKASQSRPIRPSNPNNSKNEYSRTQKSRSCRFPLALLFSFLLGLVCFNATFLWGTLGNVSSETRRAAAKNTTPVQALRKERRKENSTIEKDIIGFLKCPIRANTVNSASDLFCQVAGGKLLKSECKASRKTLLSLWTKMRETVKDDRVLKVALSAASPTQRPIGKHKSLQLWAPASDRGVVQVIGELNQGDYGEFFTELRPGSLFLDAGSNLGFVTLLTALETEATIVSFEAASPTWAMQQLNLVCNLPEQRLDSVHSTLAALGSKDGASIELEWRAETTITVRAWDAPPSFVHNTVKCKVPVRTIRSVLQEIFGTQPSKIDVFKIDCEGCEYDVIPDLSEKQLHSIETMVGEIHFGFIPTESAPSSERSSITHQRLCKHHNFVKFAKECCAFPNQIVKHLNIPVKEVPENVRLCRNFEQWSAKNKLFLIPDDSGWLNIGKS